MKYSEMIKFLNDNGILLMQAVIANEVDSQLEHGVSEDEFEDICKTVYKTFLGSCLDSNADTWNMVHDELCKRGLSK